MAKRGLKAYTKQLTQEIGEVARVYTNVNQEDADLHIEIPLIGTFGPNPIQLGLIYTYQDRDKIYDFGAGCQMNFYKEIYETNSYFTIRNADGSKDDYEDGILNEETGLKAYKAITSMNGDSDEITYKLEDQQGNVIFYQDNFQKYPTEIQFQNGEKISLFGTDSIQNNHGAKIVFEKQNGLVQKASYYQDESFLYRVELKYDANKQLIGVTHYRGFSKIKELSITYGSQIIVMDAITKECMRYTITGNKVTKIEEGFNSDYSNREQLSIAYQDVVSSISDKNGNTSYVYYDCNGLPLYEIDNEGNAVETKYDANTKALLYQSPVISLKDNQDNLIPVGLSGFTNSGLQLTKQAKKDTIPEKFFDEVYKLSGTGSISYTLSNLNGLATDNIMVILFGKQLTGYSSSTRVKVRMVLDSTETKEVFFDKEVPDGQFELLAFGIPVKMTYSKITITITLYGNASIELGGLQVIKKDFGTFYEYDSRGNCIGRESGTGSASSFYNAKGHLEEASFEDSTNYAYAYDTKGNLTYAYKAFGVSLEKRYDSNNNETSSILSNATASKMMQTGKTYKNNGKLLEGQTDDMGYKTTYDYDAYGRVTKIVNALKVTLEYCFNGTQNTVKDILLKGSSGQELAKASYTYDDLERIKTVSLGDSIYSFEYTQDLLSKVLLNDTIINTFEYDSQRRLVKQKNGSSGDAFKFVYNANDQITKIVYVTDSDLEQDKYRFEYNSLKELVCVKNGEGVILKEYSYDLDGRVTKIKENQMELSYSYDNLGNVNQMSKTLNQKTIYQSYDTVARSKGFHPEAILGKIQKDTGYMGTIFNHGNGILKNEKYSVLPQKANGEYLNLTFQTKGLIPCVKVGAHNPLCYQLSMNPLSNSGCVGFWFYPTDASTLKYLFSIRSNSGSSYIGVYMTSNAKLSLEVIDYNGTKKFLMSTEYCVNLNSWNFFCLNWMNRDEASGDSVCEYGLTLNSVTKIYMMKNPRLNVNLGSNLKYHIGYYYNGYTQYPLEFEITGLIIGTNTFVDKKEVSGYYKLSKEYLFSDQYVEEEITAVNYGLSSVILEEETILNDYEVYPLQNTVVSMKGKKPKAYDARITTRLDKDRSFNYNKNSKSYAYVADGARLEYSTGLKSTGTIFMKFMILDDIDDRQYLMEGKDPNGQTIGIYRDRDKDLYIEINGSSFDTCIDCDSGAWHNLAISFNETEETESVNTVTSKNVRMYYDGMVYVASNKVDSPYGDLMLSIGRKFQETSNTSYLGVDATSYPLLGQIQMVAIRSAYLETSSITALAGKLASMGKVNKYDELDRLSQTEIHKGGTPILTDTISYANRPGITYTTRRIAKEDYKYGTTVNSRSYETDALGNVTKITDSIFGSHTYTYNERGFLSKEDTTAYEYDEKGNLLKEGSTTFTYDSLNRLKTVGGKTVTYSMKNPFHPVSYNGASYTFEDRRLTNYSANGKNCTYTYNEQGLRISKKVNNAITNYYYDGDRLTTEINPNYRLDFLYDENGILYGFIKDNKDSYYYVRDFMQTILGIIDNSGNLVVKYGYTAYGKITSTTGTLANTIGVYNPFRYKGYYYDRETGLYLVTTRYYNPEWCRFISPDSIEYLDPSNINGMNLYAYCNNDPINKIDPTGHIAISLIVGLVVSFAIGTTASAISQYAQYGDVNWFQAVVDGLFALGSTALAYTGIGLVCSIATGAGMGLVQYTLDSAVFHDDFSWSGALIATGLGALGGLASGRGAQHFKSIGSNLDDTGRTGVKAILTAFDKYGTGAGYQKVMNLWGGRVANSLAKSISQNFTKSALIIWGTTAATYGASYGLGQINWGF